MIEQQITQPVADVDWNDDRDVALTIWTTDGRSHRRVLTRAQARELATDLIAVAETAESASASRTHINPAQYDAVEHIGRDCADGKHAACVGDAWSVKDDSPTPCTCPCHWDTITEETAE